MHAVAGTQSVIRSPWKDNKVTAMKGISGTDRFRYPFFVFCEMRLAKVRIFDMIKA